MWTKAAEELLHKFLLDLKTVSEQRGYQFSPPKLLEDYPKRIKGKAKLQVYHLIPDPNKSYLLFIHVSLGTGFWGFSSHWQELFQKATLKGDLDWFLTLLEEPVGKNYPLGYLIRSKDFIEKKSQFYIDRMGQMKILKKDLPFKHQFNNWDAFFQLLNL
jgi:hypothetical protein